MVIIVEEEKESRESLASAGGIEHGGSEDGNDAEEEGWETASENREDVDYDSETSGNDVGEVRGGVTDETTRSASISEGIGDTEDLSRREEYEGNYQTEEDSKLCLQKRTDEANAAKVEGNTLYGEGKFVEALQAYDRGLKVCPLADDADGLPGKEIRAILFSNRAACFINLDNNDAAVEECTKALELSPNYVRALLRRAQARENLENYEGAVADLKRVVDLDPGNAKAKSSLRTCVPLAEEKREKLKKEMLDKLKEAGNSILGRFGMSIDNFKTVQDPNTGSYSVQFQR